MSLEITKIYLTFWINGTTNTKDFSLLCVVALASLGYEKTCVLFNTAALASQIAAEQNLDNDEGLKAAAKYYQVGIPQRSYML